MSVKAMRRAAVVFGVTALAAVGGVVFLYHYAKGFPDRPADEPGHAVIVSIPKGASLPRIAALLHDKGLVSHALAFRLYANYRRLETKLRAGVYRLHTSMTPRELARRLVQGVAAPTVTVTIPEGRNMLEVADVLHDAGVADREAVIRLMREPSFLRRLGVPGETMEGFLFPDTYRLRASSSAREILTQLWRKHRDIFVRLRQQFPKRMRWFRRRLGWDHYEIVTLASIIEKETGKAHERPLIASVFLNRLLFKSFQPKLLQTDPTIVYGCTALEDLSPACQQFKGRIRRIQLNDSKNPYNTYKHQGLPPGPICNPGEAAMRAVFAPKRSRYLYFVSKNDGTHQFSATREAHERAVDRYQR